MSADEAAIAAGHVTQGYEPVADIFRSADFGSGGGAFAAWVDGRMVVDLWGGQAAAGKSWSRDTLTTLFSASKPLATLCAMLLVDRGELDLDTPVATYWPEFAQAGKESILVKHFLNHTAGMVALPDADSLIAPDGTGADNLDAIEARLASTKPQWEPGTKNAYHGLTFGWLVGALVRRISGKSLGTFFQDEISVPFDLEFWIGTPDEVQKRVADLYPVSFDTFRPDDIWFGELLSREKPDSIIVAGQIPWNGSSMIAQAIEFFGSPIGRRSENASAGASGNARALSGMYQMLLDVGKPGKKQFVCPETLATFTSESSYTVHAGWPTDQDMVTPSGTVVPPMRERWALGFQLNKEKGITFPYDFGPESTSFGHGGMGGQIGFADAKAQVAVGFVRNHHSLSWEQSDRLVEAVYACAGKSTQ